MTPVLGPMLAIFAAFFRAVRRGLEDPEFRGILYATASIVGSGAVAVKFAEGWSWLDAVYFTIITLTTVGYGDLVPTRGVTKVIVVVLVLVGIGLLVVFVERVARLAAEDVAERRAKRRRKR